MKKLLIFFIIIFGLTACCAKNQPVQSVVDSAKETIDVIVKDRGECKDVGEACKEQIDKVEQVCNIAIEEKEESAWNRGFMWGLGIMFGFFMIVGFVMVRIFK